MVTTRSLIPEIYYNESRDFQLLGRIFETAFNSIKTGIDSLLNNPCNKNLDDKLVDLLAKTVGFETKHKYQVKDLKIICSCFKEIIRNKGAKEAIEILIRALLKAQNIDKQYLVEIFTTEAEFEKYNPGVEKPSYFQEFTAVLILPYEVKDKILIEDVLNYILPAGFDFRVIHALVNDLSSDPTVTRIASTVERKDIYLITDDRNGAAEIGSDMAVASIGEEE